MNVCCPVHKRIPAQIFPMICLFHCWLRVLNDDDVLLVWIVDVGHD